METEREMLEWAARAAWIVGTWEPSYSGDDVIDGYDYVVNGVPWNPFHDDGDCARLEAACDLGLYWFEDRVFSGAGLPGCTALFAEHNGDKNAARRYASTQAAAQIGKESNHEKP